MAILSDCSGDIPPRPKGPPSASFAFGSPTALRAFSPLQIPPQKKPAFADFFKWRSCRIARGIFPLVLKDRLRRRSPLAHRPPFGRSPRSKFRHKKSQLSLTFLNGDPGAIRTPDPQLRRLLLYPAELQDHVECHSIKLTLHLSSKKIITS